MNWRAVILIITMLLMAGRLSGQGTTSVVNYRLRVPTAEEYLAATASVWERRNEIVFGLEQMQFEEYLGVLFIDEFRQRYFATVDAEILSDAYEQLNRGRNLWSFYHPYLDLVGWNMEIVQRQLAASPVEFPDNGMLQFEHYLIYSEKQDFDSDGTYEWLLYVQRDDETSRFRDYWIAKRDSSLASGYAFTKVPIPFAESNFWPAQENSMFAGLQGPTFQDVNADGVVEWITTTGTVEPSSSPQGSYHTYYVLGWDDNQWRILTAQTDADEHGEPEIRVLPPMTYIRDVDRESGGWRFENVDQDEALELVHQQGYTDERFECTRIERSLSDWDGQYYMLVEHSDRFTFSASCLSRAVFEVWGQMRQRLRQVGNQLLPLSTPQPTPVPTSVNDGQYDLVDAFYRMRRAFSGQNMEVAANELAQILSDVRYQNVENRYLVSLSRYYYALTLEALNHPDEALTEYVAIYEAAPESALGMLAVLHVERIE